MLNAVKHLYRIVEWIRNSVANRLHCVQPDSFILPVASLPYSRLLLFLLLASSAQAQIYRIKTLDGTNATIRVKDRAFTPFTISYSTDKLTLLGYWAPGEVKVLNNKFLEIRYYVRGGSDVGIGNTLILCISHGKLRQAMHIESYYYSIEEKKITTEYTRLLLDASNTVHAAVYDTVEFKQTPRPNRTTIKKSVIRFDTHQHIFCNYRRTVNTTLNSWNYKTNHLNKRHFSGIVPAFKLNGCEYIFIDNCWYGKGGDNKSYSLIN